MVLWCSWLSLLSNTQAVLSSSLSGIIVLLMSAMFRPSIVAVEEIFERSGRPHSATLTPEILIRSFLCTVQTTFATSALHMVVCIFFVIISQGSAPDINEKPQSPWYLHLLSCGC
jgi:hypothetical protein